MIRAHVHDGITIMQRASNLTQGLAEVSPDSGAKSGKSATNAHRCSSASSFASLIASSPEFKKAGGYCGPCGEPHYRDPNNVQTVWTEALAIAKWLGVGKETANLLMFGQPLGYVDPYYSRFYGKSVEDVTPANVIEKLELLLIGKFNQSPLTRAHYLRAAGRWYHDPEFFEIINDESKVDRVEGGANVPVRVFSGGSTTLVTKFIVDAVALEEITAFG